MIILTRMNTTGDFSFGSLWQGIAGRYKSPRPINQSRSHEDVSAVAAPNPSRPICSCLFNTTIQPVRPSAVRVSHILYDATHLLYPIMSSAVRIRSVSFVNTRLSCVTRRSCWAQSSPLCVHDLFHSFSMQLLIREGGWNT